MPIWMIVKFPMDLLVSTAQGFHNLPRLYGDPTVRRPPRISGYKSGLKAAGQERQVSPSEITRYLGVSTASTTAIIDRLEKSGHVTRIPHPTDRRSIHIVATAASDEEVRATLGAMHTRMMSAVVDMTPEESAAVVACLGRLQDAVDQVDPHPVESDVAP